MGCNCGRKRTQTTSANVEAQMTAVEPTVSTPVTQQTQPSQRERLAARRERAAALVASVTADDTAR